MEISTLPVACPSATVTSTDPGWKQFRINRHILGGWEHMVVCSADNDLVDWCMVGRRLATILEAEEDFQFLPFAKDKTLIPTSSTIEKDLVCSFNKNLEGDDISLTPWSPEANVLPTFPSTGGWVGILGLPFHLWRPQTFQAIAQPLGGLQSVDYNTSHCNDLSMARIKINGDLGRVPSRIEIKVSDKVYQLDIRITHEAAQTPRGMVKVSIPCWIPSPASSLTGEDDDVATPICQTNGSAAARNLNKSSATKPPFPLFDSPLNKEDDRIAIQSEQWYPPCQVGQGLCASPTFKRKVDKRQTRLWVQKGKHNLNGNFSDATSSQLLLEDALSLTNSSKQTEEKGSGSHISEQLRENSLGEHLINAVTTRQQQDGNESTSNLVTLRHQSRNFVLPIIEDLNNLPQTVNQVANFMGVFGIQTQENNLDLLSSMIQRGHNLISIT